MKLFWCPKTRAVRSAWLLEEAGVHYEKVFVDIRDAESRSQPAFLAASPMAKVPALEDGETAMAESAAIALYIADKYCAGTLAPKIDDPGRGEFLFWMMYTPGAIEPAMAQKFGGWKTSRASIGWGDFETMIATLETRLNDREWIMGEQFTAADTLIGASVNFMKMFGILPGSKTLEAYLSRCLARPAYQKVMQQDAEFNL